MCVTSLQAGVGEDHEGAGPPDLPADERQRRHELEPAGGCEHLLRCLHAELQLPRVQVGKQVLEEGRVHVLQENFPIPGLLEATREHCLEVRADRCQECPAGRVRPSRLSLEPLSSCGLATLLPGRPHCPRFPDHFQGGSDLLFQVNAGRPCGSEVALGSLLSAGLTCCTETSSLQPAGWHCRARESRVAPSDLEEKEGLCQPVWCGPSGEGQHSVGAGGE